MTLPDELHLIVDAVLAQVTPGQLTDEAIQALSRLLGQNTLIAALDQIDRACVNVEVVRWKTAWGRTSYEVRGSTGETYQVFLEEDLSVKPILKGEQSAQIRFCSCPAFAFYVLKSEVHAMCKHVLAVKLASRLHKFVERSRTEDIILAVALAGMQLTN